MLTIALIVIGQIVFIKAFDWTFFTVVGHMLDHIKDYERRVEEAKAESRRKFMGKQNA